jgi:ABC-type Zn uptake system ZnuABC Zn-binding protein ZnuA
MKKIIKILMLSAMSTLLFKGCASMAPPTGGEKDEEPPILITTIPAQKSTNYNGKISRNHS